jgi:hypothetical protein
MIGCLDTHSDKKEYDFSYIFLFLRESINRSVESDFISDIWF